MIHRRRGERICVYQAASEAVFDITKVINAWEEKNSHIVLEMSTSEDERPDLMDYMTMEQLR